MNTLTLRPYALFLFGFTALGCGSPPAQRAPDPGEDTSGAEAPATPTGPALSYVRQEHEVVIRIDMEGVRGTGIGREVSSLVRSYPTWRTLLGDSRIDPVQDFDRVLVVAPGAVTGRSVMLLRHHIDNESLRQRVLDMSMQQTGGPAQWRQEEGFDLVDWPAPSDLQRVLILTDANEAVVATAEDLPWVLEVARDHRVRRESDELIEPALIEIPTGTIATARADRLSERTRSRFQHAPNAFDLVVNQAQEDQVALEVHGTYADAQSATAAANWIVRQRDEYASQFTVRAVGLDRPLEAAVIEAQGEQVAINASFSRTELERVIGLMALTQFGGG